MDLNAQKERFSLSYIEAIASQAGYQVTQPRVDRDSVDGVLMADFGRRPRIEFQAKATSRDMIHGPTLHFPLSIKNYNDLRVDVKNPRILIVLLMPEEKSLWLKQTQEELCLRHCAYWMSLEGQPDRPNTSSVTVQVPTANIFNSEQLIDLMEKAEKGDALC
jgi:hypothetical protein